MKKYFLTGLIILLPVTLTFVVVAFLFNLLTEPFLGITHLLFTRYNILNKGFGFLTAHQVQMIVSQILILVVLISFTILLGFFARWFFVHYLLKLWEYIVHRIPFVCSIYKACKDVIKTVFGSKTNAFKQVVMVPFPSPETKTIGLLTRDSFKGIEKLVGEELVVVFVPTTPNPTSGFLTIFKKKDIIPLDMPIEDAFKYVISCGVIIPPFVKERL